MCRSNPTHSEIGDDMKHQASEFNAELQAQVNRAIKYTRAEEAKQRRENERRAAKEAEDQASRGKARTFKDRAYYDNDANDHYREWVGLGEHSLVELFAEFLGVGRSSVDVEVRCSRGTIIIQRVNHG